MIRSSYSDVVQRLYSRRRFGMVPGLDVIRALLAGLGDPQERFPSLHVAGSKGKGSVSALAAGVLTASGRRTGLFTSPHLQSFRERVQVDRVPISPRDVAAGVDRLDSTASKLMSRGVIDRPPTFFETATALAFDYFARKRVDAAVVEVGLGGRLDSTNVVRAPVGVITTIELEHTEILGSTLTAVAREKAGILKSGMRAVTAEPKPEPATEIERHARETGVPLWRVDREITLGRRTLSPEGQSVDIRTPQRTVEGLQVPLLGTFQARNAATVVGAVGLFAEALGFRLKESSIREGVAKTRWRGRLERVTQGPDLYLDVAHTPESARALALSLAEINPLVDPTENVLVFGSLREKPAHEILAALGPLFRTVVIVPVRSERTVPVPELARTAQGLYPCIVQTASVAQAIPLARGATGPEGFTLVTGSDYLVGEVLDFEEGKAPGEPDLSDPGTLPWTPPRAGVPAS